MRPGVVRFALAAAALAVAPVAAAQPSLVFEPGGVVAEGVTPGGSVVWFAVTFERDGYFDTMRRPSALVADEDGDGRVRYGSDAEGVPERSIWTAVDFADGGFAAGEPGIASWFAAAEPPRELLEAGPSGPLDRLRDARGYAEILVVRPAVGAWVISASDGGPGDETGANDGSLVVPLDRLEALDGGAPPPAELETGDVVVLIDPVDRQYFAIRLSGRARN